VETGSATLEPQEEVVMKVLAGHERPTRKGPADWFTGTVWIDEIAVGDQPSRLRCFRVSFEPGARTAWHMHPLGQVLHVLAGSGLVQSEGRLPRKIHAGDTVIIAPNERHWHGAGPHNTMVHLALQEADAQGVDVVWSQHVTSEEYGAK
jgi:quercetin dioxygenase-like cupin family protein